MPTFQAACRAIQGARQYQEDSAALWPAAFGAESASADRLLAVLADGMGGHTGGALASRLACEAFLARYEAAADAVRERLRSALDAANRAIAAKVAQNPILRGMGTTLVGASFGAEGLEWVSVGDSPLYLYRAGKVALVNADHSLAPALDKLAAEGRISPEQARNDPRRHLLRSALTGEAMDLVDVSHQPLSLEEGDYVILASDGIHSIETDEIARVLTAYSADGPEAVAGALLRAVEQVRDPHQDNTTVVAVRPQFDAQASDTVDREARPEHAAAATPPIGAREPRPD